MSARIVVAALTLVCAAAVSAAEAAGFATVLMQDGTCVVRHEGTEKVLFKHAEPSRAIEWALEHSRIAVLTGGHFTVKRSVTIPRPGVSLVIAPDATLEAAEDAQLTAVPGRTAKDDHLCTVIHNRGKDNVAIVNFGTIRAGRNRGDRKVFKNCIVFNGQSDGEIGIDGGLVFSSGPTETPWCDGIWLIDAKNVHVPFVGSMGYDFSALAMEGCEDIDVDVAAGLAGNKAWENETIDLNGYNRRIRMGLLIGTSPSEQILDVNNSIDIVAEEIVGYTNGDRFQGKLFDVINYPPIGADLTFRERIPEAKNVKVLKKRVAETRVKEWKIAAEVKGLPETLPELHVTVRVIGNPQDKEPVTVFERGYKLQLGEKPTAAVLE